MSHPGLGKVAVVLLFRTFFLFLSISFCHIQFHESSVLFSSFFHTKSLLSSFLSVTLSLQVHPTSVSTSCGDWSVYLCVQDGKLCHGVVFLSINQSFVFFCISDYFGHGSEAFSVPSLKTRNDNSNTSSLTSIDNICKIVHSS